MAAALSVAAQTDDRPAPRLTWTPMSSTTGDLPVPLPGNEQTACQVFDVDRDGVNDLVIADRTQAPSVVWLRRGKDGWTRYVIDDTHQRPEAGGAHADIDGDGDLDLVFGGDAGSNQIWWWENPCPDFDPNRPWIRRLVKDSGGSKHHDQLFGDFDGDGRLELASWNQGAKRLLLFEVPDDPRHSGPWPATEIYAWDQGVEREGMAVADLNGDGKVEIVGGGHWFEHTGGANFTPHLIDGAMFFTRAAAGQLKEGGWAEVAFVPGDADGPLKWYETEDGRTWTAHTLVERVIHGHSLHVADVDGDGHLDLWCGEMHTPGHGDQATAWVFRGDGQGHFQPVEVSRGLGYHEARVADLDGDGDVDVLVKPYTAGAPRVDVLLNEGVAPLAGGPRPDGWNFAHQVVFEGLNGPDDVVNADLNGDGRMDVFGKHYAVGAALEVWYNTLAPR